ncbi:EAL domain-containing protein [Cryptosporangium sp. NPDC048952]|uniref:EAL domain-containing protein n=1 Tax=Cryptosporangium sp. NPDC048952 TaxID=3363961 RepID=UPI0037105757
MTRAPEGRRSGSGGEERLGRAERNRAVDIAVFAWEWARNLSGTSWVADDRTVIVERLRLLADQAADALLGRAEPAAAGRAIGEGVVAIGFAAPDALGRTLSLLGTRLPAELGIDPADGVLPRRMASLVGAVGVGFARAAHDRTLEQQDAIRTSDLVARQRVERALRAQLAASTPPASTHPTRGALGETGVPSETSTTNAFTAAALGGPGGVPGGAAAAAGPATSDGVTGGGGVPTATDVPAADDVSAADGTAGPNGTVGANGSAGAGGAPTNGAAATNGAATNGAATNGAVYGASSHGASSHGAGARGVVAADDGAAMNGAVEIAIEDAAATGDEIRIGRTGRVLDTGYRAELPGALKRGEVVPYYQPIVALDDERLLGFEALARWEHPVRGTLPPSAFLPDASDSDFYRALGRRLRAEACEAAVIWQAESGRPLFVGVNVSPAELRDPALVEDIRELLDRTGLAPELLHLEITEDVSLTDADLPVLRGLASTGVQLTLDDFGTGLSRLAMLPVLPIHGLKLAGALLDPVRQLPFPAAQAGTDVLVTVTALAQRLGLTTTVEGIENVAEAGLARRLGIDRAQGWHYGHPLPARNVPACVGWAN